MLEGQLYVHVSKVLETGWPKLIYQFLSVIFQERPTYIWTTTINL